MPKKGGAGGGPSRKTVEKEKKKIIEDKTFGLKNKNKSKKVQQYVETVATRVNQVDRRAQEEARKRKEEKKAEEQRQKELQALFKPVVQQPKVPPGVDPKSFVCELWKVGQCMKGAKCKFAHDLAVARKSEKIDLYTDRRDVAKGSAAADSMDAWDQTELERVVGLKHGAGNKTATIKTVCHHFLEAVEASRYGWFWECPNGEGCKYVHALPPGFVIKRKGEIKDPEEEEQETIEEQIETERRKLRGGEQVTKESFLRWKHDKEIAKAEKAVKDKEAREREIAAGKSFMSGRELLVYNPDVFVDEEDSLLSTELVQDTEAYDTEQALSLQRELNAAAIELGVPESEIVDPSRFIPRNTAPSATTTPAADSSTSTSTSTSTTTSSTTTSTSTETTSDGPTTPTPTSDETRPPVEPVNATGALDESLFLSEEPPPDDS
ncbi:zinc finger protein [Pelomyxa schiedti]|nr:zinc finger protein [Pelomyxa schiedti]